MVNYADRQVVIIGLGMTGLSCVDYFLAQNVIPKVIDTREKPAGLDKLDPQIQCHVGGLNLAWLLEADLIIASPGIALSTPELQQAAKKGIEIIGDIELFCREVNQQQKRVVAITGANGKTTVSSLAYDIAIEAGMNAGLGGNIGKPALTLLDDDYDIYILELSSFQLETTYSLNAEVATILNITEDHMDRYPQGMAQYVMAKQKIYQRATFCLYNQDDTLTWPKATAGGQVSFGLAKGDYQLDESCQYLLSDGKVVIATNSMKLTGYHNFINALAALAIADLLGLPRETTIRAIRDFQGLAHRFELVLDKNGVKWINDSKATNVGSTEAALKSVICHGTLFLLLGGDGKSADFSPLLPYLQHRSIEIFCFGRDRFALAELLPEMTTVTTTLAESMAIINGRLKAGDVVLLSPACASLDQYKNYIERGEHFAQLAKQLTMELAP